MIIVILVLLGLCLGSFTNALVWRLHEQSKKGKSAKAKKELSITKGRSMCPNCHHMLATKDLIPVLSWLELRGKCRYCHKPISWQYPLVELATALLFIISYLSWPHGFAMLGIWQFAFWIATLVFFMILFIYDLKWMLLPNKIVYPLICLTLINFVGQLIISRDLHVVTSAFWGIVCLAGLFYLLFQISGGKWIGGGDVKLAIALGILVGGPLGVLSLLFIASLLGVLVSLPLLLSKRKSYASRIPFGPYLLTAATIVYLWGDRIVHMYLHNLLGL